MDSADCVQDIDGMRVASYAAAVPPPSGRTIQKLDSKEGDRDADQFD
jgi:hypothetical protein